MGMVTAAVLVPDWVAEGAHGRFSVDQMLEMAVGIPGEGSVTVLNHPAASAAGVEGRDAHYGGGCPKSRRNLGD